jgi:hypothetical protein
LREKNFKPIYKEKAEASNKQIATASKAQKPEQGFAMTY